MIWLKKLALAVVVLVALAVVVLLLLNLRADANRSVSTVTIRRPAAVVFPWLYEPEKVKQWVSWLKEIRPLSPGDQNGIGAREVWVMEDRNNNGALMEVVGESTVFEPPRKIEAKLSAKDGFDGAVIYELAEQGGETTLRFTSRFEFHHPLAKLLLPVILMEARKKAEMDLATLKQKIESHP